MPDPNFYISPEWLEARERALVRDGHRCTVARWLGGQCSPQLHVHHIEPLEEEGDPFDLDNLATACSRHHPMWEALRRRLLRSRGVSLACPTCGHFKAWPLRTRAQLAQHMLDMHGVGAPEVDADLNLHMARSMVEMLQARAAETRAAELEADELVAA